MINNWNDENFSVLERMRKNCILFSKLHRHEYLYYQSWLKYFKLPVIVLSALGSVASVGIQEYLPQTYISDITCGLAFISGVITSIELYLGISSSMVNELEKSKEFYLLSVKIFKELALSVEQRQEAKTFLEQALAEYCKLIEHSNLTKNKIQADELQPLPRYAVPSVVGGSTDTGENP